jgi:uncharacterized protein (TIGR03437 family)
MLTLGALALSLALHFEPNQGRLGPETKYVAVSAGYSVALSDTGVTLLFPSGKSLTMKLPRTRLRAEDLQTGVSNYYAGPDQSSWRTGIPHFGRVRYRSVFHGVDLAIYGNGRQVEYDWLVSPGADPAQIRFSFQGCSNAHLDTNGDLVLTVLGGELRHRRPFIYQVVDGVKRPVGGGFVRAARGQFGFRVDTYDQSKKLVIDPTLVFASGFGGFGSTTLYPPYTLTPDTATGIVLDGLGNIYVSGFSAAWNFPLVNAFGPVPPACQNCQRSWQFVAKLSPDGKNLLYSTFVAQPDVVFESSPSGGGFNEWDVPSGRSIAADAAGNVYVVGSTTGANFPSLNGQPVTTAGGTDVFVMKLNPAGQLVGTTLLGGQGNDLGNSIVLGADGGLYVTGTTESPDFPTTYSAYQFQPSPSLAIVFLAKLNPAAIGSGALSASPVIYSTCLGPGSTPLIATDPSNNAYVAAQSSLPWSTTPGVFQSAPRTTTGGDDIVLAKVNPSGTELLYATYFDGSGHDYVNGLAVDSSGSAYLSGYATSADVPTTSGSLQPQPPAILGYGNIAGFVARFSADATKLIYATYLGGTGAYDYNYGLAVDSAGNAYVGGASDSVDFPIRNGTQVSLENSPCPVYADMSSATAEGTAYCASAGTLTVLNPQGSAIVWSTFLGSGAVMDVALDSAGNVYAAGANIFLEGTTLGSGATNSVGVVKFAPQGTPVQFSWNGLTNAASFNPGLPGPGGLASVFVHGVAVSGTVAATGFPLPTTLAGVSILVDGTPAPILVVADLGSVNGVDTQQINFQVPFEAHVITSWGVAHVVELRYGGLSTYASPQNVGPGIFVLPDGTPAIQHAADYSPVTASNPVVKGETIVVYATGLGSVVNGPATGMPATGPAPMSPGPGCGAVTINAPTGGAPQSNFGNVVYAGLTPGYVGLYQLNVTTLPNLPSGAIDFQIDYNQCWPIGYPPFAPPNYSQSNTVKVPVQ